MGARATEMKQCACGFEGAPEAFRYGGQMRSRCPDCVRRDNRERDRRKRAQRTAQQRRWASNNRERVNARIYRWRRENPDTHRHAERKRRRRNPETARAAYRRSNRRRVVSGEKAARRAASTDAGCEYGLILLLDPCSYCGEPATSLDHIVPLADAGDGDWSNLTAACGGCNSSKHTTPLLLFLAGAARV